MYLKSGAQQGLMAMLLDGLLGGQIMQSMSRRHFLGVLESGVAAGALGGGLGMCPAKGLLSRPRFQ